MPRAALRSRNDFRLGEDGAVDAKRYLENRAGRPLDGLEQYAGKYVAWSPDGTRIIAWADSLRELAAAVKATAYDPRDCALSSVPSGDEVLFGGVEGE